MTSVIRFMLLFTCLFNQATWAGGFSCDSTQSGAWEDVSTWTNCGGIIPGNDTFVTIKTGHVVTLNTDTAILNEFVMEASSELIIADVVGGITMTSENDPFNSSLATLTLLGDLTIEGDNVDVNLGTVDGAAGLTINSPFETRFSGTIGVNTALTALITDAVGTLVFANTNGEVNTPNITVTGIREFNDPMTLERTTHISGSGGQIIFNNTINGNQEFILSQVLSTDIIFNADVGSVTALNDFRIFNSFGSTALLNMDLFRTNGRQQWDLDMIIDPPSQLLSLINSSTNDDIRIANDNWIRGATAGLDALQVNSARDSIILGEVGDNGFALLDLNVTAQANIVLETSSITVADNMIFNSPVTILEDIVLTANVFNAVSTVHLDTFDLALDTDNFGFFNTDISGSGDLIKTGTGVMGNLTTTSMTGNVFINGGFALDNNSTGNPFPAAQSITLSDIGSMGDGAGGNFNLSNGQTIAGNGVCQCVLVAATGSVISPGTSPGELFVFETRMNTGSTLALELDGTADSAFDRLSVETLNLDFDLMGGSHLDLTLNFEPNIGDDFTIIPVFAEQAVSGTFNGLPEGALFELGGYLFSISYVGGSGNDVVLTVVGEARYHVDSNAVDTGLNDGLTWDSAFLTLQDALAVALENTEIWVAAGTYYPDEGGSQIDNDELSTFTLKPGVSVYGGFFGDETDLNDRAPYSNLTVLSGDIDGDDINDDGNDIAESTNDIVGSNAYHVINGAAVDSTVLFDGFTITAGNAVSAGNNTGAGMFCGSGLAGPAINQTTFIGNYSSNRGSASYGCTTSVTHSDYINNSAGDLAGAVRSFGGHMENVTFSGNFATIQAGAIDHSTNPMTLINAEFIGNSNGQGFGGAIRSDQDLYVESSLFSGNRADQGGAINMLGSHDLMLVNVTMTGNRAIDVGGAIYSGGTGSLNLVNSVIWNNQDSSGLGTADASILYINPSLTNSYSLIQGFGTAGTGNLDEDPVFDTDTNPADAPTTAGYARPTFGSPIVNVGDNSAVTVATDIDGEVRIDDVTVDMGAYEGLSDLIFKNGFE